MYLEIAQRGEEKPEESKEAKHHNMGRTRIGARRGQEEERHRKEEEKEERKQCPKKAPSAGGKKGPAEGCWTC